MNDKFTDKIEPELEKQLDNVIEEYLQDEDQYREACVKLAEKLIQQDDTTMLLYKTLKTTDITNAEAKRKTVEFVIKSMDV